MSSAQKRAAQAKLNNSLTAVRLGFEPRDDLRSNSQASFYYPLKDATAWQQREPGRVREPPTRSWGWYKARDASAAENPSYVSSVPFTKCNFGRDRPKHISSSALVSRSYQPLDPGKNHNRAIAGAAQKQSTDGSRRASSSVPPRAIARQLKATLQEVNLPFDAPPSDYITTMDGDPPAFVFGASQRRRPQAPKAQAATSLQLGGSSGWSQNKSLSATSPMSPHFREARHEFGDKAFLTRARHLSQRSQNGVVRAQQGSGKRNGAQALGRMHDNAATHAVLGFVDASYHTTNPMSQNFSQATAEVGGAMQRAKDRFHERCVAADPLAAPRVEQQVKHTVVVKGQVQPAHQVNVVLGYARPSFQTTAHQLNATVYDLQRQEALANSRQHSTRRSII